MASQDATIEQKAPIQEEQHHHKERNSSNEEKGVVRTGQSAAAR